MVFTSTVFLFAFFPVALIAFYLFPPALRAVPVLVLSCLFYGWGEPVLVLLVLVSMVFNYGWGVLLGRPAGPGRARLLLTVGIAVNLLPLLCFKYLAFLLRTAGLEALAADVKLPLPIGVSFYTFMAISYLVDIHRRREQAQATLLRFGAFLTMFPHLVAGPIVRWSQIGHQLARPVFDPGLFGYGALRVSGGLVKKVVIADSLSPVVDGLFAQDAPTSVGAAWLGAGLYALQIYFDFSGYSDIAIGLAAMMGIRFEENFHYPYLSRSAREFWQRWHISLGSWFRDYVYFPMGGSRRAAPVVWRNLLVVWALTGFWHGAAWTFMLWGLYFGLLIGLERSGLDRVVKLLPRVGQHAYGLLAAVLGWVLFRAVDVGQAGAWYRTMFGFSGVPLWDVQAGFAVSQTLVVAGIGVALAAGAARPFMDAAELRLAGARAEQVTHALDTPHPTGSAPTPDPTQDGADAATHGGGTQVAVKVAQRARPEQAARGEGLLRGYGFAVAVTCCVILLLLVSTAFVVSVTYSPFIYFRF